jgi:hypothetical protein
MGSKLSSVSLPKGLRETSFAGIKYATAELDSQLAALEVPRVVAETIQSTLQSALAEDNPMSGASKLLDAQNLIKASLSTGSRPELMRVNRIGFVLGHGLETAAVVSRGNPTQSNINTFVGVTQKWRSAMPDDIAQCGLPANLKEAIRRTNIAVNTVDDLNKVVDASKDVLTAARKVSGRP